jgi:tRNA A-37 threonylcarbamoyl transferase component Bud32
METGDDRASATGAARLALTRMDKGSVIAGKFRIDEVLGQGAMGVVVAATHLQLEQRVALKFLLREVTSDPTTADRFLREARASASLRSENICRVSDFGTLDTGEPYLVMELLEGRDLATILAEDGPIPVPILADYIAQACAGLAEAHARGIVHRDLKPGNLFLTTRPDGRPLIKIVDFGIAKASATSADLSMTRTGAVMGSPGYMAPEQLRSSRLVDARSDIWSLGVILYELASGRRPFTAETFSELILRVVTEPAPPLDGLDIPPDFARVVHRCLEQDPARRYHDVNQLATELAAFCEPPARERALARTRALSGAVHTRPQTATPASTGAILSVPPGWNLGRIARWFRRGGRLDAVPAPGGYAATPEIGHTATSDVASVLEAAIPPAFRDLLPHAIEFFRALFRDARRVGDRLIELRAPAFAELQSRSHHLLFLSAVDADPAAPFGQVGTRLFRAEVDPLARQLAGLKVPPRSVLITVLAAPQLGQGARETIFAIHRERNLVVVPIAAAEIRRACEAGTARDVLLERIADLHTVSDPFAIRSGSTDPTRWIGFAAEVSDLVKHIVAGGKIVSVAGPPGSGKTSLIAMAQYGCDTNREARQFVWIPCGELSNHDPHHLLGEMTARVQRLRGEPPSPAAEQTPPAAAPAQPLDLRSTIVALGGPPAQQGTAAPEPPDAPATALRAARTETGLARCHQLVLVLEDADWLIRMASTAEPDEPRRAAARELWRGLVELCASGQHTVIVTSIRDFQIAELAPRERPVPVSRVPMNALNRTESNKLVRSLGELVAFQPTGRASEALYRLSGGNVYALRLLCSEIIRAAREQPSYSPLAPLRVKSRRVRDAAARIVATGSSFQGHVALWLDGTERVVLQYVARQRPRSLAQIHRALHGTATPDEIGNALGSLELMSLVWYQRGRHRVRIPLFERWINTRLDGRSPDEDARRRRRTALLTTGFTIAALLFAGYWAWLRTTRGSEALGAGDCTYELDRPDRIGPDDEMELFVYQDCATPRPTRLTVESIFSALTPATTSADCGTASRSCTMRVKLTAGEQAHDQYRVRLSVDGRPLLTAAIDKDRFSTLRAIGKHSVPVLSLLTAALTAVLGFHRKIRDALSQARSGSEPPPPSSATHAGPPA